MHNTIDAIFFIRSKVQNLQNNHTSRDETSQLQKPPYTQAYNQPGIRNKGSKF